MVLRESTPGSDARLKAGDTEWPETSGISIMIKTAGGNSQGLDRPLQTAFEAVNSMKPQPGISVPVSTAASSHICRVATDHNCTASPSSGPPYDDKPVVDDLPAGRVDRPRPWKGTNKPSKSIAGTGHFQSDAILPRSGSDFTATRGGGSPVCMNITVEPTAAAFQIARDPDEGRPIPCRKPP